jgi:hypothetical protein
MNLGSFGQAEPVKGLHAQPYGAAVDAAGNADCEQGQRGYPSSLSFEIPASAGLVGDPTTPGNQGPTFTGVAKVPKGETFTSVAEGLPGIDPGNLRP